MIANRQAPLMTPQDYLDWEEQQPLKYDYIEGEVYAMTGGTMALVQSNDTNNSKCLRHKDRSLFGNKSS